MLILALATQLAVPIGHPEVVVHKGFTGMAVLQDSVEEGLYTERQTNRELNPEGTIQQLPHNKQRLLALLHLKDALELTMTSSEDLWVLFSCQHFANWKQEKPHSARRNLQTYTLRLF